MKVATGTWKNCGMFIPAALGQVQTGGNNVEFLHCPNNKRNQEFSEFKSLHDQREKRKGHPFLPNG